MYVSSEFLYYNNYLSSPIYFMKHLLLSVHTVHSLSSLCEQLHDRILRMFSFPYAITALRKTITLALIVSFVFSPVVPLVEIALAEKSVAIQSAPLDDITTTTASTDPASNTNKTSNVTEEVKSDTETLSIIGTDQEQSSLENSSTPSPDPAPLTCIAPQILNSTGDACVDPVTSLPPTPDPTKNFTDEIVFGDANKLTFTPKNISGDQIKIKLSDYSIPGIKEGDEISTKDAVSVILGVTTHEQDLEKKDITNATVPVTEKDGQGEGQVLILRSLSETTADVVASTPVPLLLDTKTGGEKIEKIADNLINSDADISKVVSVSVDGEKSDKKVLDSKYISFEKGSLILVIDRPAEIVPGAYTVSTTIHNPITGEDFNFTQDFTWGILTMNTNQDVYQVGQSATIDIGILDQTGLPVCGLSPELTINGQAVVITETDQCEMFSSGNIVPDYTAQYTFAAAGEYVMELKVDNGNGVQTLAQTVTVTDAPTYIVSRSMATRLYPAGVSPASFTIASGVDFVGTVTETLPAGFSITEIPAAATVITNGETQTITWGNVSIPAGTTATFTYTYDAPNISPMYYTVGPVELRSLDNSIVYTEARTWGIANDVITNGSNATDILGQYTTTGGFTPNYNQTAVNNNNGSVYALGLNSVSGLELDSVNHRLFAADTNNHRVLVFNLDSSNNLVDKTPDFVLGQTSFTANTSAVTQAGMNTPTGLAYDSTDNFLYVSQTNANRVTVYDVASITNGENAIAVLGQASYTASTVSANINGMSAPNDVEVDHTAGKVFVADTGNNRVSVFSLATNGSIGASYNYNYFSGAASCTQSRTSGPKSITYDPVYKRLYVADSGQYRVLIMDAGTISDGFANAIGVIGKTNYTDCTLPGTVAANTLRGPVAVKVDPINRRLYIADNANRVVVHDINNTTNGQSALFVLGQADFTSAVSAVSQNTINDARDFAIDSTNGRLYSAQYGSHRVIASDVVTGPAQIQMSSADADGDKYTGATIDINVKFNQIVTVTGTPQIPMETGATDTPANYVSGSGTDTLLFRYTVAAADSAGRLDVVTNSSIILNGGTIKNAGGLDTNLKLIESYTPDISIGATKLFKINQTPIISNGKNAFDQIGHYTTYQGFAPDYSTNTSNGGLTIPYNLGLSSSRANIEIDTVNHRLFDADTSNNRVLVFNLDSNNNLIDKTPDFVLGQPDFTTKLTTTTQSTIKDPWGLAYDSTNQRLFVSENGSRRVSVFDVSSITNGENAVNVIGQTNFTSTTTVTSQSGMFTPSGIEYDGSRNLLYVADNTSSRITVYDTTSITDGMNASYVIGQSSFTGSSSGNTINGLNSPVGLSLDPATGYLYVADWSGNRVKVFDTNNLATNMPASYVLGQTGFTTATTGLTNSTMSSPTGVTVDSLNKRLFRPGYIPRLLGSGLC